MRQLDEREERLRLIHRAKKNRDGAYLIEALRDPDNRIVAAKFLADLGAGEATEPIANLLRANDPVIRAAAALALGKLSAVDAVTRLVGIAEADSVGYVRAAAVDALGSIGDRGVVPSLVRSLSDPEIRVRRLAAVMLGRLGDPRAVEPLRAARARERWSRRRPYGKAVRAIQAAGGR